MFDPKVNIRAWPPAINCEVLPEPERRNAVHLVRSLFDLVSYANDFRMALALYDFCEAQTSLPREWQSIAGRDGAMSIYHFGKSIEGTMALLGLCPTLFAVIDRDALRATRKMLRELFPRVEAVRHAVAHSAELVSDPDTADENAVTGPYTFGNLIIEPGVVVTMRSCFLGDRKFVNTIDGAIQAYELSQDTMNGLAAVRSEFYSAFSQAARDTQANVAANQQGSQESSPPDRED